MYILLLRKNYFRGGESGIRTHASFHTPNGFQDRTLNPLEYLSKIKLARAIPSASLGAPLRANESTVATVSSTSLTRLFVFQYPSNLSAQITITGHGLVVTHKHGTNNRHIATHASPLGFTCPTTTQEVTNKENRLKHCHIREVR